MSFQFLEMATVTRFEELEMWKLSRKACQVIGLMIDRGSFKSNYRLIGQIEGASGSVMDNIAEGFERGSKAEFILFLGYAKGSCGEFRSQLYRSMDRKYITNEEFDALNLLLTKVSGKISALISYLQKSNFNGLRKMKP